MRYVLTLTMILFIGLTSKAGELVTYQGRLTDLSGDPVANGNYALIFSLWDDSTAGSQQWIETHASVAVTDGLFSVNLGKDGALDASIFETEPLFLQVQIGYDDIIGPRTRLTSAPTAVAAKKVAGDLQTGDGYMNLNSSAGEIAFSMTTGEKGQTDFRMYNINPGYLEQMNLSMSTDDYGGHLRLYPTGEIQPGPAFTIGFDPTPFRYPYLSFYDPSGSFPNDPSIKMGVEPSPFMEMYDASLGIADRPLMRMGVEPTPFHHGYLAFKNPDVSPPPKLMEIGINDESGDWESLFRMYSIDPGDDEKETFEISNSLTDGISMKLFNPQPEPPAKLMEMKVEEIYGPTIEWGSSFKMFLTDPINQPVLEMSASPSTGASFKMATPLPEPPAVYFDVNVQQAVGPSMGFYDDIGQVMGLDPSPFNEGFSVRLIDPGDDGSLFELTGNHVTNEVDMYLIDPVDKKDLLTIHSDPTSGASLGFFDDIGQVMGFDPSPFNQGFSVRLIDPDDDGSLFELTGNHVTNEIDMYLIDPVDKRDLLTMHSDPTNGASFRMFNPQPEPPAKLFDLSIPIGVKASDDVVMTLTSGDSLYQTKITPGRVKVGHPTNDNMPRSELNAGSDTVTFYLQGNTGYVPAPPIGMMSSSTEAKMGIGTITPSENLVVGDDMGAFNGTRVVVGSNVGNSTGFVFGESANYRGWMLWDIADDLIEFGTKEGTPNYGSTMIMKSGTVGIGGTSTGAELHVIGDICYTGSIGTCSDERYKRDIRTLDNALDRVSRLRGVSFNWKKDEYPQHKFSSENQVGLVAQEVKEVLPQVVTEDNNGYYNIDYIKITPILIEAIKELKSENEELKQINENLIRRIEKLEAQ